MRAALAVLRRGSAGDRDDSHRHAGHEGARDGRGHFAVDIVGECFAGLAPLARHRPRLRALGEMMQTDIHALQIRARTPAEPSGA
jgi:BolA protein